MNKLTEILDGITDNDLVVAIEELQELDDTGILPSGVIRYLSSLISTEVDIQVNHANSIITSYIYRTAAKKWAEEYRKMVDTNNK